MKIRLGALLLGALAVAAPAVAFPADTKALAEDLAAHAQPPDDFVVNLFRDHDVVYLGEGRRHGIRQNLVFLQRLIPKLHAAGVYDLAYEMANSADQVAIDALLAAPGYDDDKALEISFRWDAQNGWAYREYADVFRAAWELNHRLPAGAPRFRILGFDYRPDWSLVKPGDPIVDRKTRGRAWAGNNQVTRNVTMADIVLREGVDRRRKVLVFGGGGGWPQFGHIHLVPTVDPREEAGLRFSAAYLIRRRIGDRIASLKLSPDGTGWPELDAVLDALPAGRRAVGFDLRKVKAGALPLPSDVAATVVTDRTSPTLADIITGIVHLAEPVEPVTLAEGFLTEARVAAAKADGTLPDVPEVTVPWILENVKKVYATARTSAVPKAAAPASSTAPRPGAPPTALESLLSAPAHGDLVAAPAGRAVAWVVNDRGRRNLWAADGDPLRARALTSFTDDDGQGLQEIAWSPDGRILAFVRGAGEGASGKTLNPSSAVTEMGQDVWLAFLDGTAARRLGSGRAPALSGRGDVAYVSDDVVWLAPVAGGSPARLFDPHGNAADLQWTTDGSALAFSVRRGAHSLIGVYRRGQPTLSWVAPSVDRDLYPRWSPDGRQIAFARLENIDSKMKSSGRWGPLDSPWSLRVSDVAENGFSAAREVFRAPARPLGSFPRNAQLLRWVDGGRLAFVSEHEDWARLYVADPASPAAPIALSPAGCEVEDPSASADGRSLFFAANCGDLERRHVWRAAVPARGASPAAAEALTRGTGIETFPAVTADGRTVVFHRNDPRTPGTPTALSLADGATAPLLTAKAGIDTTAFVTPVTAVFKAPDGLEIHGALFAPASVGAARRPAIVHVHGGPTAGQDLLGWNPFFQYLVSRGYVVLGLNYRGGAGYGRPFREVLDQGMAGSAEYQDVVAAAAYLRARPDVDPARVGIFGASYGGYLTMLALARNSDLFAAGVTECGIYDMSTNPRGASRGGEAGRMAKENSAVGSIDKWRSPVLIIHGDDDPGVDFDGQTIALVRALRARNVPFEQLVYPDEGHSSSGWAHAVQVRQATADFFGRQFKTPAAGR